MTGRITPAYAGSTTVIPSTVPPAKDHPRVCGEHLTRLPTILMPAGSPPRMRGAHAYAYIDGYVVRITPAYAGSTPRNGWKW